MEPLTIAQLEAGLDHVRRSPRIEGTVELIVARPAIDARELLDEGRLDMGSGLVGDNWYPRGSGSTSDGSPDPDRQLTVMNARTIALIAQDPGRWALAGDQLYVDLDLSVDNLPPGAQLALGSAVIEVSAPPHTGCAKFSGRFGRDALRFVSTPEGRAQRLRGLNARVVQPGVVRRGDIVTKI